MSKTALVPSTLSHECSKSCIHKHTVAINTARDRKGPAKNTTRNLSVITSSFTSSFTYLLFTTVHIRKYRISRLIRYLTLPAPARQWSCVNKEMLELASLHGM